MNASHHRWLREQLPKWEHEGLVTAEAAQTLRDRHAVDESQVGAAQIIMGSLGALLVGTGLIAVIGYNWDDFSRPVRLLFAFLPLLATQIFSFRVLQRGAATAAWVRETAALLQALATGACIALVSQIYNLGGDWPEFLFWWFILSLPLVWVMRSQSVAIFYLIAIAVWSVHQVDVTARHHSALLYPVLLLGLAPFWPGLPARWQLSVSLQWVLTLSVGVGLGAAAMTSAMLYSGDRYPRFEAYFWLWVFTAAVLFLLPLKPPAISDTKRHDPHVALSGFFLLVMGFMLTFADAASEVQGHLATALKIPWAWICLVLVALFTVSAARQERWGLIGVAWLAVTPILSLAMGERAEQFLPWLMTSHILAVGIMLIVLELNGKRGSPRVGATLICVLILVRACLRASFHSSSKGSSSSPSASPFWLSTCS